MIERESGGNPRRKGKKESEERKKKRKKERKKETNRKEDRRERDSGTVATTSLRVRDNKDQ